MEAARGSAAASPSEAGSTSPLGTTLWDRIMSTIKAKTGSHLMARTVLLLPLVLAACGDRTPVEREAVARPVRMMTIGAYEGDITLEIPGSVSAAQTAELAFEVPGRMLERIVQEGEVVEAGDVVARLDDRDYVAERDRARARRDTDQADYERYATAFRSNAVTEQQVSQAKGQFDIATANLAVAQKALDDTVLRAPFTGRIARRLVDDFANVRAKEAVLLLQDELTLEMRVDVAERDWVRGDTSVGREELTRRLRPRVMIAALADREFPAVFKEISAAADPVTRTYAVTLGFQNPDDVLISPGMTGRVVVNVYTEEQAGVRQPMGVPASAVSADADGNPRVWVIDPDTMTASSRFVEIGVVVGESIEIESGLSDGEIIATSGVNSLVDGMMVREMDSR